MKRYLNKIIQGDCLEVMKDIPDGSIDAVICDPPYGTTACKWDTIIPFEPMWEQLKRVTKKNGAIVLFGSQPFTSALVMSNPKMFKYEWVWIKAKPSNFLMGKKQPMKYTENILVFYRTQPTYNPIKIKKEEKNKRNNKKCSFLSDKTKGIESDKYGARLMAGQAEYIYPRNYLHISHEYSKFHPTQKPVALMEYLIKTYTNESETVLDFTIGSGTTAVACKRLNRNFIGIELEQKYVDIANQRLAQEVFF